MFVLNVVDGCMPSDLGIGTSAELEEERRLLYVAMTRAKDDLQASLPDVARHSCSSVFEASKGCPIILGLDAKLWPIRNVCRRRRYAPADHSRHLNVRFRSLAIAANSTAIARALHGAHTPEFRGHHTNTQAPPNEQAGTAVPEQPLVARVIGSLLDK